MLQPACPLLPAVAAAASLCQVSWRPTPWLSRALCQQAVLPACPGEICPSLGHLAHPPPFLATLTLPCAVGALEAAAGISVLAGGKEHHSLVSAKVLLTGAFAAIAVHSTHHHLLAAVSRGR